MCNYNSNDKLDGMKNYLEWRFRTYNDAKYLKYMHEWVNNVPLDQYPLYRREMMHLIWNGIYEP